MLLLNQNSACKHAKRNPKAQAKESPTQIQPPPNTSTIYDFEVRYFTRAFCSISGQHTQSPAFNLYKMEDIDKHLAQSAAQIKSANKKLEDRGNAIYQHAQLLVAVGRHEESLTHFEDAMQILTKFKSDFIWKRTFCSLGVQYATALDFLGNYDKASEVFKTIMEVDPQGFHIGDYALFLHRRKREFDRAQGYELFLLVFYSHIEHLFFFF